MDLVERVARAICGSGLVDYMVKRDGNDGAVKWAEDRFGSVDGYVDAHWRDHVAAARAAMEAMREAAQEPIAWRVRREASNMWAYCETEREADFSGGLGGMRYVKEPVYAALKDPVTR